MTFRIHDYQSFVQLDLHHADDIISFVCLCLHSDCGIVCGPAASKEKGAPDHLKEDVRDNVVSYNDEGGGEEDTQAFDIGTLRNPEVIDTNKLRRDIMPEMLFPFRRTSPIKGNTDVRDFISGRLQENDSDPTAPPYDSLATYAYEGNGSLAESLSSLESAATDGDQEFEYLSHWGPQFKKLADMYIGQESQRET